MRRPIPMFLSFLLAAPLLLAGCGKQSRSLVGPETESELATATVARGASEDLHSRSRLPRVLFVHASPDAPAVDIRIGRRKVAEDLAFPGSTRYREAYPGLQRVRVNVANTATTVIDARVRFAWRQAYSVFAVNQVANLEPLVLTDDLTPPAKGNAHVRFVHLSPNAPAVDVALQGGAVVFGNRAFKEYTPFTPLPAGSYDLEVRLAGTQTVVLPLPGVRLEPGTIYTVFAKGFVGGKGDQALGAGVIVNSERRSWRHHGRDRDDDDARLSPVAADLE